MQPGDNFPHSHIEEDETGARDFMLKKDDRPGYLCPETLPERRDTEIDHFSPDDLEKIYPSNGHQQQRPKQDFGGFSNSFSQETTTIMHPDGRHETTTSKRTGEDCITVTTIKHPDGKEERHESNACPQLKDFSMSIGQMPQHDSFVDRLFRF